MQSENRKVSYRYFLLAMAVAAILVLGACGGGPDDTTTAPEGGVVETPTAVTELQAPEAEATAAEGVVSTDTMTESTDVTTDTVVITDTVDVITETTVTTDTTVMTDTMPMTDTGAVTETGAMTGTGAAMPARGFVDTTDQELVRASTLVGYDFESSDGNQSGNLNDLLIDISNGDILFASIEYGGFLDIGDKNVVVPMNAFRWTPDNKLVINFDEQTLKDFPDLGDNWPNVDDSTWSTGVNDFWMNQNINPGVDFTKVSGNNVMWAKDIMGYPVMDMGEGAGTIDDLIIDLTNAQAKYALVGFPGAAGGGDPLLVPFSAFDVANRGDQLALNSNIGVDAFATMPRFQSSLYPSDGLIDPTFDDQVDTYWNDMGYPVMHNGR